MLLHILGKIIKNDDKVNNVDGINITNNQLRILDNYKVDIKGKSVREILKLIDNERLYHIDSNGLPRDEHYEILDSLYLDIDKQNKRR